MEEINGACGRAKSCLRFKIIPENFGTGFLEVDVLDQCDVVWCSEV